MPWTCSKTSTAAVIVALGMAFSGCALFRDNTGPKPTYGPREQAYLASFEEVWRAANLVLQTYPLRVSNMDQGVLETDTVRGYRMWSPPHKEVSKSGGNSYRLTLRVIRGNLSGKSATKVTIVKDSQLQTDFFAEPKPLPSDGLEERSLLYRIGREIEVERALEKATKRASKEKERNAE